MRASWGRPLAIAIALAVGIGFAPILDGAGVPPTARWVAALAVGTLALRRRELVLAAVVATGLAAGAAARTSPPPPGLATITGTVEGPVVRSSQRWGARLDRTATWVWSPEPIEPGERITATGELTEPSGPRGPGLPDPVAALRARGADRVLAARSITRLEDDPDVGDRAWRWAAGVRATWIAAIDDTGGDPTARAALRGIAVGDRRDLPPDLAARWKAAGIIHVLSVSGLHLAAIAGLAYLLLRRAIAASPWGGRVRPAAWAAPIALVLAVAYTLITGAQIATVRALVVVAAMLLAAMLDRPVRLVDALGLAAIAILAWRPADLFDPGFQLSFVATLALAVRRAGPRAAGIRGWVARQLACALAIALATAPITAFHFHQVAVGGAIGNLVLTPAVELVALPLALVGLVTGWDLPVALATTVIEGVDRGAAAVATIAPVGRVAIASGAVVAIAVALALVAIASAHRRRVRAVVWIALCVTWSMGRSPAPADALRVTFVDVGQGDAAIVELPDGEVWLIDAGGNADARDPAIASRPGRTLARVLAAYGHDRIDVAVVSHPHPDHYLGLLGLLASDVPIDELWFAPEPDTDRDRAFAAIADRLAARGTRLVHPPLGVARRRDGVELATWAPRYQPAAGARTGLAADPVRDVNDNSLVVSVGYRGRVVLFTGDLEAEGEEAAIAGGLPPADIVKVPHHGSPTSSSQPLIDTTRPALAVISCGRRNHFGFPSAAVVARWVAAGARIARTDTDGSIVVVIDADGSISVEHSRP